MANHSLDLTNSEDTKKLGLETFAFVNFARIAVPFRLGLALNMVPWVEENIMSRFKGDGQEDGGGEVEVLESEQVMMSPEYENEQTVFEGYAGDANTQLAGEEEQAFTYEVGYQRPQLDSSYDYSEENAQIMAMSQTSTTRRSK